MSSTPSKVTRKEACLQAKGPFKPSKDLRLKRCLNILWKEELKEIMDFMKLEGGGVHYKIYNGCCTKQ
jgi:hypothetical protein